MTVATRRVYSCNNLLSDLSATRRTSRNIRRKTLIRNGRILICARSVNHRGILSHLQNFIRLRRVSIDRTMLIFDNHIPRSIVRGIRNLNIHFLTSQTLPADLNITLTRGCGVALTYNLQPSSFGIFTRGRQVIV